MTGVCFSLFSPSLKSLLPVRPQAKDARLYNVFFRSIVYCNGTRALQMCAARLAGILSLLNEPRTCFYDAPFCKRDRFCLTRKAVDVI